jgi:hypothetical protein
MTWLKDLFKGIYHGILDVLVLISRCFFPNPLRKWAWYYLRIGKKLWDKKIGEKTTDTPLTDVSDWGHDEKMPSYDEAFAQFLKNNVTTLAPMLHYTDLVNLGLTSTNLYHSVFASKTPGAHFETLRVLACAQGSKAHCWACNTQICKVR